MLKAEIDKKTNELVIRIPASTQNLRPSKSGKTLIVASTNGNQKTDLEINGQPVVVGLNAYVGR